MEASQPTPPQDGAPDVPRSSQQQQQQQQQQPQNPQPKQNDHNSLHSRRMRPPTLESFARDENRVPLRPEKLHRTGSKMGLRSLFGRSSRTAKDVEAQSPTESRGIRSSLADFGSWPHVLHASRSEAQLSTISQGDESSATGSNKSLPPLPSVPPLPRRTMTSGNEKPISALPIAPKGAVATWNAPPLFQAYPQAIRHAHLPAPVMSADALIRHNTKKGADLNILEDLNKTTSTLDADEQDDENQPQEKLKRRHRRNTSTSTIKLDWTTKVYVLVTSGYLLQYSGEGQFDRLPEKILKLSKSSAAFASDSIPGRHWVLQICSAMEADGTPSSDSRSIFSKIGLRGEKRSASNFLMVFEDADDMESWIVLLRREIEALGGKKNLSETGKPKIVEALVSGSLRAQSSQRTLVVRDPERFSRVFTPEQITWRNEAPERSDQRPETPPEHSYDDVSTTTSIVSTDGRQLEGLRDSGNRLSYLSSGQRTGITSNGSSPVGSPVRESFSSEKEDPHPYAAPQDVPIEPRLRPNASIISDRRQSMQSLRPIVDCLPGQPFPRPHSTSPDAVPPFSSISSQAIPNFSVPQSSGRRYSFVRSPTTEGGQFPPLPLHAREPLMKGMRRPPPTALPMTRPLSTVADQPSPVSPYLRDATHQSMNDNVEAPDSATIFSSWTHETTKEHSPRVEPQRKFPVRRSSFMPVQGSTPVTIKPNPRRFSSMQAIRTSVVSPEPTPESHTFYLPKVSPHPRGPPPVSMPEIRDEPSRCRSAMDSHGPRSSVDSLPAKSKRASMMSMSSLHSNHSQTSDLSSRRPAPRHVEAMVAEVDAHDSKPRARHVSVLSGSSQQSLVPGAAKNVYNRRSMPQLADGPPPAPPPNCALPPLPQKHPQASASHWKTMRI